MRDAITFVGRMIQTQSRESITVQIPPEVTAKAATIAAKSRNKNTISVLEEWLIEKAAEFPLPEEVPSAPALVDRVR